METWNGIPRMAPDPELPGSGDLVGPAGAGAVSEALAEDGWTVQSQRPVQAVYHPGRSLLVRHVAWAVRGEEQRRFAVCTEVRADDTDAGDGPVTWIYPADPGLPALSRASADETATEWARELVPDVRSAVVNSVAYRPRRRAVLRYRVRSPRTSETPRQVLYAKVMPEAEAERAWELGEALRPQHAPLALPARQPAPGVLLFDELPGASLRDLLLRDGPLPNPDRVVALMDQVAAVELPRERTSGRPARPALRYARRLTRKLLPDLAGTLAELSTALKSEIAATPVAPAVIHGDLYEGQVMVGEDFSLALLDLDDLGVGDPALDAASFCAHLLALADTNPAAAPRILAYRALLRERFLVRFDVSERGFAARESLVMLQLASGPFRVLEERWPERVRRRVELAQGLLTDWERLERAG